MKMVKVCKQNDGTYSLFPHVAPRPQVRRQEVKFFAGETE
jgi:hypothetical protein